LKAIEKWRVGDKGVKGSNGSVEWKCKVYSRDTLRNLFEQQLKY
jgi:hypothetical protein